MLINERDVKYLRTGTNGIRYAVALINCSTQSTLYAIDVVTPIQYSADPGIKIYAFDNPKAAVKYIKDNVDSTFVWPQAQKKIDNAPGYFDGFPEASIICAGKAKYPANWTYPSPIGISGGSDYSVHGKGFLTDISKKSYSGPLCQGFIVVLVTIPSTATFPSDTTRTVKKCNDCGYIGMDFGTNGKCPQCGDKYKCTTCDYEGITPTCPHCNTISPVKTPNTETCYTVSNPIAINTQFRIK